MADITAEIVTAAKFTAILYTRETLPRYVGTAYQKFNNFAIFKRYQMTLGM